MKTTINLLLLCCLIFMTGATFAQTNDVPDGPVDRDPLKYAWQFDVRSGYNFLFLDEDFMFVDYKGGPMLGASVSKYWDWIGVGLDFDWMRNKPDVTTFEEDTDFTLMVMTNKINRYFIGLGPNFKYQLDNNKFSLEFAPRVGLAMAKGGEALAYYVEPTPNIRHWYQSYKSALDRKAGLGVGARLQLTYWFHDNVGVHAGTSYIYHHKAPFATTSEFGDDLSPGYFDDIYESYVFEVNNDIINLLEYQANTDGEFSVVNPGPDETVEQISDLIKDKYSLHTLNVFGGLSFRVGTVMEPKAPKDVSSDIEVTVEDKQTGGVLEGATVQLFNDDGSLNSTQMTNKKGETVFKNVAKDDYTIKGMYNGIPTSSETVNEMEFKNKGTIEKTLYYDNPNFTLMGLVKECFSSKVVSEANVKIQNTTSGKVIAMISDAKGEFTTPIEPNSTYKVVAEKKGYFSNTVEISTANIQPNGTRYIELEICITEVECNTAIRLDNILYDLDKYYIRADAKPELNRVVQFLKDNPEVRIEMSSHTDSRASHDYNQTLSQNRAKAAVDYIVSQGISRDRLIARGYGETMLLNRCADDVPCTEAEHQLNRRTEFKVICPE